MYKEEVGYMGIFFLLFISHRHFMLCGSPENQALPFICLPKIPHIQLLSTFFLPSM
jgi:hypothetical protein